MKRTWVAFSASTTGWSQLPATLAQRIQCLFQTSWVRCSHAQTYISSGIHMHKQLEKQKIYLKIIKCLTIQQKNSFILFVGFDFFVLFCFSFGRDLTQGLEQVKIRTLPLSHFCIQRDYLIWASVFNRSNYWHYCKLFIISILKISLPKYSINFQVWASFSYPNPQT